MNARELLDVLDSSGYIEFSNAVLSREHYRQNLELLKSALRLLAAAEANDGTTPETDARVNYEIRAGISLGESAIYDIARTLEMERKGLAVRVEELERDAERVRLGLALSLDPLVINSDNIGGIRRSLFLPVDCVWNAMVRELTAERENKPPRHRDDVQQEIDAARSKP